MVSDIIIVRAQRAYTLGGAADVGEATDSAWVVNRLNIMNTPVRGLMYCNVSCAVEKAAIGVRWRCVCATIKSAKCNSGGAFGAKAAENDRGY
jgi:hypothetical protein